MLSVLLSPRLQAVQLVLPVLHSLFVLLVDALKSARAGGSGVNQLLSLLLSVNGNSVV
jgi:hypothetical protein